MKKIFTLFALLTACIMGYAQTTYHVVYIPGDGERQFGFSLAPSFCNQHLNLFASNVDAAGNSFNYDINGSVNNLIGFNAGMFYGYETQWGRFIEWGNYTSLFYSITPFSSDVTFTHNGVTENHKIKYNAQQVILHINPFLSHRINEQFSVSLGLGASIAPRLTSKVSVDGQQLKEERNMETSLLQNLLNVSFDVNAGVKYWFTDEWHVGLRMQYNFASLVSIFSKEDSESIDEALSTANGKLKMKLDKETAETLIFTKNSVQAVFSIGYTW